jgi:16S rRNA processing protein RimM
MDQKERNLSNPTKRVQPMASSKLASDTTAARPAAKKPTKDQAASGGTTYQHRNEAVFIPDGYIAIGRVTAAHSLQGEVRVELHTDFPERFTAGVTIFIGSDLQETAIDAARPHKQIMLVKLVGVNNRNSAELLRGQWLFVREADAVPLDEDTFWVHEIIGMTVQTEEGEELGVISDVLFTGANDVYVLQGNDAEGNPREVLLPAIADVVQRVDPEQQRMIVHLLPGLL